jgi:hypothetical protein
VLILAAAAILASNSLLQAPAPTATVRVPVANVWAAPNAGHLPLDPHAWPTARVSYAQRIALVGHMPTQVLYGETVRVLERRAGWTQIAVPDRPRRSTGVAIPAGCGRGSSGLRSKHGSS